MGFGQTMITVAFLVVLTMAVISANKLVVDKEASYYESLATEEGSTLANNLLNEISTKYFDEAVAIQVYKVDTTYLTPPSSKFNWYMGLDVNGPDGTGTDISEYYTFYNPSTYDWTYPYDRNDTIPFYSQRYFDDVDDYNGYFRKTRILTSNDKLLKGGTLMGDTLTVSVYYVQQDDPEIKSPSGTPTYLKKIDVTVRNRRYLKKDLLFSTTKPYTF